VYCFLSQEDAKYTQRDRQMDRQTDDTMMPVADHTACSIRWAKKSIDICEAIVPANPADLKSCVVTSDFFLSFPRPMSDGRRLRRHGNID